MSSLTSPNCCPPTSGHFDMCSDNYDSIIIGGYVNDSKSFDLSGNLLPEKPMDQLQATSCTTAITAIRCLLVSDELPESCLVLSDNPHVVQCVCILLYKA